MYALSLSVFKDVGFKFEPHVCNKCHDVLMTTYELKNIAIKVLFLDVFYGVFVEVKLLIG